MALKKRVRLGVLGASGRMGNQIINLALRDPRVQVVAGIENPKSVPNGGFCGDGTIPVYGNLKKVLPQVDALIDFTAPKATLENAPLIAKAKKALVVGTTGLSPRQIKTLKGYAKKTPIVFSPNMSVGVNLLFKLVEEAARALAHYDLEIVEAHHNLKKDAPSGTAMKLAQIAAKASGRSEKDFEFGRSGQVGARKKKEIGVFAVRAGDIVGDHTVYLSHAGERLELVHRAHSRDAFASGAIEAAVWASQKRPGFYSMFDVLKI